MIFLLAGIVTVVGFSAAVVRRNRSADSVDVDAAEDARVTEGWAALQCRFAALAERSEDDPSVAQQLNAAVAEFRGLVNDANRTREARRSQELAPVNLRHKAVF